MESLKKATIELSKQRQKAIESNNSTGDNEKKATKSKRKPIVNAESTTSKKSGGKSNAKKAKVIAGVTAVEVESDEENATTDSKEKVDIVEQPDDTSYSCVKHKKTIEDLFQLDSSTLCKYLKASTTAFSKMLLDNSAMCHKCNKTTAEVKKLGMMYCPDCEKEYKKEVDLKTVAKVKKVPVSTKFHWLCTTCFNEENVGTVRAHRGRRSNSNKGRP